MTQPAADTLFSDDWLSLRESADHLARDAELARLADRWLNARHESSGADTNARHLVDLGCGSGSNLRYLAPRFHGIQQWRLIDHDAALLERAIDRCESLASADGRRIRLTPERSTLKEAWAGGFDGVDLVTASALFDLLTFDDVASLVAACRKAGCAALFTLSVDGDIRFHETGGAPLEDEEDRFAFATLRAHQRRDKGAGNALGTGAPQALRDTFQRHGFRVRHASSPWYLDEGSITLIDALMDGWRHALHEQDPAQGARIDHWHAARLARIRRGEATLRVGHQDLLAMPPESAL